MTLDPIKPYLPLVYALLVALAVGALWNHHRKDGAVRDERDRLKLDLTAYKDAQAANLSTIDALRQRIATMVEARRLEAQVMQAAVADARAAETATAAKLAATTEELNHVYAKYPTARAWGAAGVDARVADRLPGGKARRD